MILSCLFISFVFLICGIILYKFPSKKINIIYGYRSKRSIENIETWNYSQKICGLYMIISGVITLLISSIIYVANLFIIIPSIISVVLETISIIVLIGVIPYTEIKLKKKFN